MKNLKMLVLALMLIVGASVNLPAAVLNQATLTGFDEEFIVFYDSEFNVINSVYSYQWEANILVFDDQEGYVELRWWNGSGWITRTDTIGANLAYWLIGANSSSSAGFVAAVNYLFPLF